MMVFQQIVLAHNVLLALVFGVGYFVAESPKASPKAKARMGVLLGVLWVAWEVLMLLFAVSSAVQERNALYLALSIYVVLPFVIGRLASYRTLRFYSALQLLALLASAVTLYVV